MIHSRVNRTVFPFWRYIPRALFPHHLLSNTTFCSFWQRVTATQRQVNIADRMWARLVSSTNQPNFVCYNKFVQQLHKQNTLNQADEIESYVVAEISKSAATSPSSSVRDPNQLFATRFLQYNVCELTVCSLNQKENSGWFPS